MTTRVSLDHQRRMLRHLEAQTDTLKNNTAQLKHAISRTPDIPSIMGATLCPRCRIHYLRRDGTCECAGQ